MNFKIENILENDILNQIPLPYITTDILDLNLTSNLNRNINLQTNITYIINKDDLSIQTITLPKSGYIGQQKTIIVTKGESPTGQGQTHNIQLDYMNSWGAYNMSSNFGTTGDILFFISSLDGWALAFTSIK